MQLNLRKAESFGQSSAVQSLGLSHGICLKEFTMFVVSWIRWARLDQDSHLPMHSYPVVFFLAQVFTVEGVSCILWA